MKILAFCLAQLFSRLQALFAPTDPPYDRFQELKEAQEYIIDSSYDSDLQVYTIPAYFGTGTQQGGSDSFVLDMGTSFIAITAKSCDNCSTKGTRSPGKGVFNPDRSDSFIYKSDPD